MLARGEREAVVMAPPPTRDSAILPCFHGCLAFLHRLFPPQSPPSHPLNPSLCSQQQPLPWDFSTIPKLQLAAAAPSRGPASLSRVCMAAARTVWDSFHLGCHRLAVLLSALSVFPLTQTVAPMMWGVDACFSSPACRGQVQSYSHSCFPPSSLSYWVLCASILFLWSGTPVHSQLVSCMHFCVWRCIPHVSVERDVLHSPLTSLPSCSP